MNLEGEHSVMSVLQGAALAGARTFTATCGPGLAFMFEPYIRAPGMRLPMVCALVTRDVMSPQTVWGGQQDAMIVREAGWIQMYCETGQEVLDTVIMAYKIAEHRDVMLPVNVCCDGNYLCYGVTRVEVPDARRRRCVPAAAGRELARRARSGAADGGRSADRRRRRHRPAHLRALSQGPVPRHAERAAGDRGRCTTNGPSASAAAMRRWSRNTASTMRNTRWSRIGSMTGAAKNAVDVARDDGERVGLIKMKTFRPFPLQAMVHALSKVEAIGVVDRAVGFGWNCGPVFQETLGALYRTARRTSRSIPAVSFIGGLSGADITEEHFARAIERTAHALAGERPDGPVWLNEND